MNLIDYIVNVFCDSTGKDKDADGDILALLGAKTDQKHWLAASLSKTIRLQQVLYNPLTYSHIRTHSDWYILWPSVKERTKHSESENPKADPNLAFVHDYWL
ncbi:MAG: hypothetical protein ACYS80_17210 [Planctomycetota bacterium]